MDKGNSLMTVPHIQPHGHGSVDAIIKKRLPGMIPETLLR